MSRTTNYIPSIAIFVAGAAVAAVTVSRRTRGGVDSGALDDLKKSVANLETRVQTRESVESARLVQIESKLESHAASLADVPSTSQIVAAMEQLLSKTM